MERLNKKQRRAIQNSIDDAKQLCPEFGECVERTIKRQLSIDEARKIVADVPDLFDVKPKTKDPRQRTLQEMMVAKPWKNPRSSNNKKKVGNTKQVKLDIYLKKQS